MIARICIAAALAGISTSAAAQDVPAPTAAQATHASRTLGLLVSALNSKEVPQPTKNGLFGCIYEKPLSVIAAATADVLAKNKQIDPENATQQLVVLAGVCGAPLAPPAPAAATPDSGR